MSQASVYFYRSARGSVADTVDPPVLARGDEEKRSGDLRTRRKSPCFRALAALAGKAFNDTLSSVALNIHVDSKQPSKYVQE